MPREMKKSLIKELVRILKKAQKYISKNKSKELKSISNHAVSIAGVFYDKHSLSVAVIIYAVSKLLESWDTDSEYIEESRRYLENVTFALEEGSIAEFQQELDKTFSFISNIDKQFSTYIDDVLQKSKIKKGNQLHEFGMSIARAAKMTGTLRWDIQYYSGQTTTQDRERVKLEAVSERIQATRSMFKNNETLEGRPLIIFDAGPVISVATNNMLWILDELKQRYTASFLVPTAVKKEIVDHPLLSKRFKFEALQVSLRFRQGVFEEANDQRIAALADELLYLANHIYRSRGSWIKIVHYAEMQVVAAAIILKADAVAIDERTTRLLVENPCALHSKLKRSAHTKVFTDQKNLAKIKEWLSPVRIIRSVELVTIAYEDDLLNTFLPESDNPRRILLEAILWGVKLNGCAVTSDEIGTILTLEGLGMSSTSNDELKQKV